MGVRRAVEMALDTPEKYQGPICTFGSLIHNPQVLDLFEKKGISVINEVPCKGFGTILIRAHGVPPDTKEALKQAGFNVVDATCPRVIRVQTIIRMHARNGYASIIIGDQDHPEVIGLLGYTEQNGYVVSSLLEFEGLPAFKKAIIVAQTTQNQKFFSQIKTFALKKYPHYKFFNTICDSTEKRQMEVNRLSKEVDAIVVVGGKNSANTQRLAEIARQTGKQTFHIETEADLDLNALAAVRKIGITAGASTPNWIIKRVYRALEIMPLKQCQGFYKILFSLQRSLLLTNIFVALGAGCLSYAATLLQGHKQFFPQIIISVFYVLSMHILNNLTGSASDRYNDPERADFYDRNKRFLIILAFLAGAIGLLAAMKMGLLPFLILLIMSLTGLAYNLRIVPKFLAEKISYQRIRDIPGSKTILIAIAWGIITSTLPALAQTSRFTLNTIIVFCWTTGIVFIRTAFFDILDMQGDRIVGKETIPILLGDKRAFSLLKAMLWIITIMMPAASLLHIITGLGYFLIFCPILIYILIVAHQQGYMLPGIRLEFLVESLFVLAGIIAFLWSLTN